MGLSKTKYKCSKCGRVYDYHNHAVYVDTQSQTLVMKCPTDGAVAFWYDGEISSYEVEGAFDLMDVKVDNESKSVIFTMNRDNTKQNKLSVKTGTPDTVDISLENDELKVDMVKDDSEDSLTRLIAIDGYGENPPLKILSNMGGQLTWVPKTKIYSDYDNEWIVDAGLSRLSLSGIWSDTDEVSKVDEIKEFLEENGSLEYKDIIENSHPYYPAFRRLLEEIGSNGHWLPGFIGVFDFVSAVAPNRYKIMESYEIPISWWMGIGDEGLPFELRGDLDLEFLEYIKNSKHLVKFEINQVESTNFIPYY